MTNHQFCLILKIEKHSVNMDGFESVSKTHYIILSKQHTGCPKKNACCLLLVPFLYDLYPFKHGRVFWETLTLFIIIYKC